MKIRIVRAFLASIMVSALVINPVLAASVEDIQSDKNQAEAEAQSLQSELQGILDKIDTLESDLEKKQVEVEEAGNELEEAAAKQTEQYESMKLRIKYMYEEGNGSFLQTLLSATSFTDLLNKAEYISEVHSYDRTKLQEYEETTQQVETMRDELQTEYEEMETMQADLEVQEATLNEMLSTKQAEIAQLDQNLQDAIAAREEAERQAREEAERQAQEQAAQQQAAAQQAASNNQQTETSNTDSSGSSGSDTSSYVPPQGQSGAAVVAYARQFIGNPYVYGGTSLTNGCDCSGFTQSIYAAFGVSLPRVDSDQANCGYEVPLSQAQAGDLLCYWGHVGIYNGSGGIIHASSPGVGIVEFSNCQYRTLKCVRRIL